MRIKSIVDKLFGEPLYIKLFYLLVIITQCQIVTKDVTAPFVKLSLVYGCAVVLYDLFTRKRIIKNRYFFFIVIFFFFMAVSVAANYKRDFVSNFKLLAYAAFEFFVVAMVPYDKSEAEIKKEYKVLSLVAIAALVILGLASFVTFVFYIQTGYTDPSGTFCYVGVAPDNRLYGISGNANILALQMLLLFALSLVYTVVFNPKKKLPLYVIAAFAVICMLLTGSRSAIVGFFVFTFCFVMLVGMVKANKKPNIKIWAKSAAAAIAVAVIVFAAGKAVTFASGYLPPLMQNILQSEKMTVTEETTNAALPEISEPTNVAEKTTDAALLETSEQGISEQTTVTEKADNAVLPNSTEKGLSRVDTERSDDETMEMGSGRIDLWKAALKVFKEHPLFGVGYAEVYEYAKAAMPDTVLAMTKWGHVHNLYLQILVSNGIFSFIIFLGLLVFFAVKALIKLINGLKCVNSSIMFISVFCMIVMLLTVQFFEVKMMYRLTFESLLFSICFGYLQYYLKFDNVGKCEPKTTDGNNGKPELTETED